MHQLDGAEYLRARGHERLARLVARHSEARFEVEVRGAGRLLSAYEPDDERMRDALTYCDLTTSATRGRTTLQDRLAEIVARYCTQADDEAAHTFCRTHKIPTALGVGR